MSVITENSKVKIHYTGKFENGEIFDSSIHHQTNEGVEESQPIDVELGKQMLIPGFENALKGMSKGENKTVTIPFNEAYGPIINEYIQEVPKEMLPEGVEVGDLLQTKTENDNVITVIVREVKETTAVLDANHLLAGKDLTFDITIVDII